MAYLAAVMAHPAFTARFKDLISPPGLRVPLTADAALFAEAVALGREVIWLHCYGERFVDAAAGRPKGPPRLPKETQPIIPADGDDSRRAGAVARRRWTTIAATQPAACRQGLSSRMSRRRCGPTKSPASRCSGTGSAIAAATAASPIIGDRRPPSPLDNIQPEGWLPEYTTDLLDLLNVLGRLIALHPAQAALLERICDGPLSRPICWPPPG